MSRIVRTVRSRGYELDAMATIPASTMLRYLEYMRWESANDPEVGLGALFENGYRMVVRAQQLALVSTVGLDVDLSISMELGYVGRASLEMVHEVVRADGGAVASAVVTAVYLSPEGRPHPIPPHVRELSTRAARTELVAAPFVERPRDAWSREMTVMHSDLDLFNHVNHARYLDYFNDTRLMAARANAFGAASEMAKRPIARAALDYRRQALAGDALTLTTWLLSEGGDSLAIEMRNSEGEVLSMGRIDVAR